MQLKAGYPSRTSEPARSSLLPPTMSQHRHRRPNRWVAGARAVSASTTSSISLPALPPLDGTPWRLGFAPSYWVGLLLGLGKHIYHAVMGAGFHPSTDTHNYLHTKHRAVRGAMHLHQLWELADPWAPDAGAVPLHRAQSLQVGGRKGWQKSVSGAVWHTRSLPQECHSKDLIQLLQP